MRVSNFAKPPIKRPRKWDKNNSLIEMHGIGFVGVDDIDVFVDSNDEGIDDNYHVGAVMELTLMMSMKMMAPLVAMMALTTIAMMAPLMALIYSRCTPGRRAQGPELPIAHKLCLPYHMYIRCDNTT